jgi:hypothetical protein
VGGRTRSRIRSNISKCRPQHVLPPTGASISETIEFVNCLKPQVQVILRLTVSQCVSLSWCRVPAGAQDHVFYLSLWTSTVFIVLERRGTTKRVCPLLKELKYFTIQCSPISKIALLFGGGGAIFPSTEH